MQDDNKLTFRPARQGDGQAIFDVTHRSVQGLVRNHYSPAQIAGWMGERTPAYYEDLIRQGKVVVAERAGAVVGFVDAVPGEVTRLFVLPQAAGQGLGTRLLEIGLAAAGEGHNGPIRVEATRNAEAFYRRHGFKTLGTGYFSHGPGGEPIEIVHMER